MTAVPWRTLFERAAAHDDVSVEDICDRLAARREE